MSSPAAPLVRPPAVAGLFYPGTPGELDACVTALLQEAEPSNPGCSNSPGELKALIVPHAGYLYSGPVAAHAYGCLAAEVAARRDRGLPALTRVVLLGPAHRVALQGMALPAGASKGGYFQTPLGRVALDTPACAQIASLALEGGEAHREEHSLEVQLPFLQTVLKTFDLVPLVVGACPAREVAALVDTLWGGPETLFVISTDLSHYLPYDAAVRQDRQTLQRLLAATPLGGREACGAYPLNGFLAAARSHGLTWQVLDMRNSGDTAGGRDRVVGYAALAAHLTGGTQP